MVNDEAVSVVRVSSDGTVTAEQREYARDKLARLTRLCREPVRGAQAHLVIEPHPTRARPAEVEAAIDIDGVLVRAHVAATQMNEAIDLVADRLRRRVERVEDRRHRMPERRAATNGNSWRHGELPAQRPEFFPRPPEEREILRRKTFASEPMTIDEAAFDLDALAHDFYLFCEISTGRDCLIFFRDGNSLGLSHPDDARPVLDGVAVPVQCFPVPAAAMAVDDARERLDLGLEPFVFFFSSPNVGAVFYRRRDGHYGLIEAQRS